MTNNQKWVVIILSFTLALLIVIGGCFYGSVKSLEKVLSSPALSSDFTVEGNFTVNSETGLRTLSIDKISGSVNSKILDLILLTINEWQ